MEAIIKISADNELLVVKKLENGQTVYFCLDDCPDSASFMTIGTKPGEYSSTHATIQKVIDLFNEAK